MIPLQLMAPMPLAWPITMAAAVLIGVAARGEATAYPVRRRLVSGLVVAVLLATVGGAFVFASDGIPYMDPCNEQLLREIYGDWWYWAWVLHGCGL